MYSATKLMDYASSSAFRFVIKSVFVSAAASIDELFADSFSGVVVESPFQSFANTIFRGVLTLCCEPKKSVLNAANEVNKNSNLVSFILTMNIFGIPHLSSCNN